MGDINVKWRGSNVQQDTANRLVSDTQIANWNNKSDKNHTHNYLPLSGGKMSGDIEIPEGYRIYGSGNIEGSIGQFENLQLVHGNVQLFKTGYTTYTLNNVNRETVSLQFISSGNDASASVTPIIATLRMSTSQDVNTSLSLPSKSGTLAVTSDIPTTLKNPNSIIIKLNNGNTEGTNLFTYDGSSTKTINITPSDIGAAAGSHEHTKSDITDFPTSMPASDVFDWAKTPIKPSYSWDEITNKPTDFGTSVHTHLVKDITDFPSSMPASDVYAWAKSTTKPSYSWSEITNKPTDFATSAHTHLVKDITDFPTSMPASDVFDWAKAAVKPSYSWSEIEDKPYTYNPAEHNHDDRYYTEKEIDAKLSAIAGGGVTVSWDTITGLPETFTPSAHTHKKADITDFPISLKNPTNIIIKINDGITEGTDLFTYDGSTAKTINITPDTIGAAAKSHNHDDRYYTEAEIDKKLAVISGGGVTVSWDTITDRPSSFTPSAHTHVKADITDFPNALKNPNSIIIKINSGTTEGTNLFTYDGSSTKNINITLDSIGAAASDHAHDDRYYSQDVIDKKLTTITGGGETVSWGSISGVPNTFIPSEHTHVKSDITDFPESMKNPTALKIQFNGTVNSTYDGSIAKTVNITPSAIGAAASTHTHAKTDITDFPESMKNPNAIIIKVNSGATEGTDMFTYDGSAAKIIDITANTIGSAAIDHNHDDRYYTEAEIDKKLSAIAGGGVTVSWDTITGLPETFTPSAHTHKKADITDFPTALKNPTALTIQLNGTVNSTYDGSVAKTVNITPASIGAASKNELDAATKSRVITDWNDAIESGFYYSGPTAANNPDADEVYYCGSVIKGYAMVIQTAYPEKPTGDIYKYIRRGIYNSANNTVTSWEEWNKLHYVV